MRYQFDGFIVDVGKAELTRGGIRVRLAAKPLSLLILLAERHPNFVPKDDIHTAIWTGVAVSDASLSTAVKELRQALVRCGGRADLIRTVHGRGFALNVPSLHAASVSNEGAASPDEPVEPSPIHWARNWPPEGLPLSWAMANHRNVNRAISSLLRQNETCRYLPIQGPSESGKSLITRQLFGDSMRWDGFACGRLDFKGTIDIEAQLQQFVHHLGLPSPPSAGTVAVRLSHILRALLSRPRPTLIIFDTFEAAGDVDQWVREHLLIAAIREPLLRVIIAGQRVPERGGSPWDAEAAPTIVLDPLAPEDWLDYGRTHRADVTLEFVRQAYAYCRGRASVLAQLLGPLV